MALEWSAPPPSAGAKKLLPCQLKASSHCRLSTFRKKLKEETPPFLSNRSARTIYSYWEIGRFQTWKKGVEIWARRKKKIRKKRLWKTLEKDASSKVKQNNKKNWNHNKLMISDYRFKNFNETLKLNILNMYRAAKNSYFSQSGTVNSEWQNLKEITCLIKSLYLKLWPIS